MPRFLLGSEFEQSLGTGLPEDAFNVPTKYLNSRIHGVLFQKDFLKFFLIVSMAQ